MAKCSSRYKWFFVGSDGARCFDFRSRKHADRHNEKFKRFYEGSNKIKQAALNSGMRTLRQDGVRKVLSGQTTVKEVMAVTMMDI